MSCDAIAASAMLWLASFSPAPAGGHLTHVTAEAPASVAKEPLFADIVRRAGALKGEVAAFRKLTTAAAVAPTAAAPSLKGFDAFSTKISALADLDMKGHLTLAARGTDGDLKCILRGISQDLPLKLKDVTDASSAKAKDTALRDLAYLLNDNVEVITAPPAPAV